MDEGTTPSEKDGPQTRKSDRKALILALALGLGLVLLIALNMN